MKPTPAQIEKLIIDNMESSILDIAKLTGLSLNKVQRIKDSLITKKVKRKSEIFKNLKFKGVSNETTSNQ